MKDTDRHLLTGKQLAFAIEHGLPVFFMLTMHNPYDQRMSLKGTFYVERTGIENQIELFSDKEKTNSQGYSSEYWNPDEECYYVADEAVEEFYAISNTEYENE